MNGSTEMLKYAAGAAFLGVFIGALTTEVIHRVDPELGKNVENKAKDTVNSFFSMMTEVKKKYEAIVWGEQERS